VVVLGEELVVLFSASHGQCREQHHTASPRFSSLETFRERKKVPRFLPNFNAL